MSTFRGIIEELPGISMDRFEMNNRTSSTAFFLSHFHGDHTVGLDDSFFQHINDKKQYIYCTPLTKTILVTKLRLSSKVEWINRIVDVAVCNPMVVSYRDPNVDRYDKNCEENCDSALTVTAVPAGHCPGSVMFMFEAKRDDKDVNILCTGDFRIHPHDFAKLKPLHVRVHDKLVPRSFDNIYLDTTFYGEIARFPNRSEALGQIVPVVEEWLGRDPQNFVVFEISANYGSEDLFCKLSASIKQRIHVRNCVQESYRFTPELSQYTTEDQNETRVHACIAKGSRVPRESKRLICRDDVEKENILTIIPSAWRWIGRDLSEGFTAWEDRRFYVCYSCHPSSSELREFIDYFKPMKIHPCVVPGIHSRDAWRPEAQGKFKHFQKKIIDELLVTSAEHPEKFECDFMEFKSFKRRRPKTDSSSDDEL
ncbi:protein artemis isoform X1 [Fopius arisanus]|uniref:Protein artemis n=2 Tax=Fopius arisanus TaxID=64838 RepID=A0A0C9S150_9HYME|nr:PREDICTED: protein artemis isoform X1 [Fopius arisanus]